MGSDLERGPATARVPEGSQACDTWEWRQWLEEHVNRELGVGAPLRGWLDRPDCHGIETILEELGRPQHRYQRILVAGTNGKTTTTRACSALLHACGLRVGTYTSPHVEQLNERIAIDGVRIPDQVLAGTCARIGTLESELSLRLTWFEIMTTAALMWFAHEHVDIAVIEVGLGGEHDATAVAGPALVALTNIDLDHTEQFGTTRREVAAAEASIITAGQALILGETDPGLRGCFTLRHPREIWTRGVEFVVAERVDTSDGQLATFETPAEVYDRVEIALRGREHAENINIAMAVAEYVTGRLPETIVRDAIATLRSPGRIELIGTEPRIVLDGAHNPAAARALGATLLESFPADHRVFVLGISADKSAADIVAQLGIRPRDKVLCCSADSPRAMPADELVSTVRSVAPGITVEAASNVEEAVYRAVDALSRTDLLVVTGSLYVVAEARLLFQ